MRAAALAAAWRAFSLVAAAAAARPARGRSVSSLDAGWRFQLVARVPGPYCAPGALPLRLDGQRCPGLQRQGRPEDGGPASADACRRACCGDDGCNAWQWCGEGVGSAVGSAAGCAPAASCWVGYAAAAANASCPPGSGWVGQARAELPRPDAPHGPCPSPECQPDYDDSQWRVVDVPHDFVVEGKPSPEADKSHGYLPYGVAWYRRVVDVPADASNGSVWLDFEGVMVRCKVWLNGVFLLEHKSGYVPFRLELGAGSAAEKFIRCGRRNVLALRVDATEPDGWWYDGGGIYRHVWLSFASAVHIAQWGVYAPARVRGPIHKGAMTADAEVRPSVEVRNQGQSSSRVKVICTVRDALGTLVDVTAAPPTRLAPGTDATIEPPAVWLPDASLWTLDRPVLYVLAASIAVGERGEGAQVVDSETVIFGVRSTGWSATMGFELNGVGVKILGACNHQDFPAVGVAVPDALQEHRVRRLKELGANAWRTAHNPPNAALLDTADRLGMLVWDENHRNGREEEMASMVRRDRNHPSIIIWSVCNEALCNTDDAAGDAMRLKAVARRLDPLMGRMVSANDNSLNGLATVLDVQGFDYSTEQYDRWHVRAPQLLAISSETSSAVSDRGEYESNNVTGHVSGFDTTAPSWGETAEFAWEAIFERPFIAGGFTWSGWDYRGEPTPYAWPDVNSHFGVLDVAGFWKDRAYWYLAWWARPSPPALHVFPHWTWSAASCRGACREVNGSLFVDMWAYSNAAAVEFVLPNGTSLGRRRMPNYSHVEWPAVPYQPGRVAAKAFAEDRVTVVAEAWVETTGAAEALRLRFQDGVGVLGVAAPPSASCGRAPTGEVALVVAEVVDRAGRVVPGAADVVAFSAEAGLRIVGTANGDPASRAPGTASALAAFHGLLLAVVRPERGAPAGRRTLTATAAGLVPAHLEVEVLSSTASSASSCTDAAFPGTFM